MPPCSDSQSVKTQHVLPFPEFNLCSLLPMFSHMLIHWSSMPLLTCKHGEPWFRTKGTSKMPPLIVPSQSSDVSWCWMHNFLWALIDFVPAPCLKYAVPSCFLPRVFSSAREKMEPWQNCRANILVAALKQWSTAANGKMFLPLVL